MYRNCCRWLANIKCDRFDLFSSTAEPQDECLNCGKVYLLLPAGPDGVAATPKGCCKKCNNNNVEGGNGSLSDKESSYSINKLSSPEMSFHESEEEEEMEEEEDAYLEVID